MPERTIEAKDADRAVAHVVRQLGPDQTRPVIGRFLSNMVQAHLIRYNADHPNKLGGKRTNYFARAAKGTSYQETGDGVTVSIRQIGIRQHYFGGVVRPGKSISPITGKPTQYLTIPAIAEAHGKSAREIPDLEVLHGKGGRPIGLVQTGGDSGKKHRKSRGMLFYWLVKQATIRPNHDILPKGQELKAEVKRAVKQLLMR